MNTTEKLGLRLPEDSDFYDVADFNYNFNILDTAGGSGMNTNITVYVVTSASGGNWGEGTQEKPYVGIQAAIDNCPDIQNKEFTYTINVAAGTYPGFNAYGKRFTIVSSGSIRFNSDVKLYDCDVDIDASTKFQTNFYCTSTKLRTSKSVVAGTEIAIMRSSTWYSSASILIGTTSDVVDEGGLTVTENSRVSIGSITVYNKDSGAISASYASMVSCGTLAGSGNVYSISTNGSIVFVANMTISSDEGISNIFGGRVFTGTQFNFGIDSNMNPYIQEV